MFANCIPDVLKLTESVVIECHRNLVALFARSFPGARIQPLVPAGEEPRWVSEQRDPFLQIAMGDLPGHFRRKWEDFPRHHGYLKASDEKVNQWKRRLNALGPGPKIGISWRGGLQASRAHLRSISIETITSFASLPCKFISLQYGNVERDIERANQAGSPWLTHWQDAIDDYDETAALVMALDGVVSVCTSLIHLTGALGQKVFILAPAITEWRYLDKGDRMPWYPSAKLLRQKSVGDWTEVIDAAKDAIRSEILATP